MSTQLSFKAQMAGLLADNMEKYPDAMKWLMKKLEGVDVDVMRTDYEKFVEQLEGGGPFQGQPYDPSRDNYVELIRWHRNKHGTSLKHAKLECDNFIQENYYETTRAKNARGI